MNGFVGIFPTVPSLSEGEYTMFDSLQSADPAISRKVSEMLSNRGMRSPCRIVVATKKGTVTLSGLIQYEQQRRIAVKAAGSIAGVQSVQDQMRVIPKSQPVRTIQGDSQ
jgi:osmotically-inducible protein OsmY